MSQVEMGSWGTGIDYMAMTAREKGPRSTFEALAVSLMDDERARGSEVKPFTFRDYEGFRCGSIEYGTRYDDALVRISGPLANYAWEAFYGSASTVARLDLQTTVWDHKPVLPRLRKIYEWADSRPGGRNARPVFDLRQNTNGGGTLYVGRRQSAMMGRLYDCGAYHREPQYQGSIRAEVETHGRRASQLSAALVSTMVQERARAAFCTSYFRDRIHSPTGAYVLLELQRLIGATDHAPVLADLPRLNSDCARSLQVARKQWRNTAQRLVRAGLGPDLLVALGLAVSASGDLRVCDESLFTREEAN